MQRAPDRTRGTAYERAVAATFDDAPARMHVENEPAHGTSEIALLILRTRWWYVVPFAIAAVVLWIRALSAAMLDPIQVEIALGVTAVAVLAPGFEGYVRRRDSRSGFFRQYARARGLTFRTDVRRLAAVPLLQAGTSSRCEEVLQGSIGGRPASLANFTHADVTYLRNDVAVDSNVVRYHVLHVRLPDDVANRYPGVHALPRPVMVHGVPQRSRGVRMESLAFEQRYALLAAPDQDEIALYELFTPTFIDALSRGPHVTWQQVGHDLVFFRRGHCLNAMQFDRFAIDAQPVIRRYLEEWQ